MGAGMFKAPTCWVGAGASKNGGEAANFCEFIKIWMIDWLFGTALRKRTLHKNILVISIQISIPYSIRF